MLEDGVYEQLITIGIREELAALKDRLSATATIDQAEAPRILAGYVAGVIEQRLASMSEVEIGKDAKNGADGKDAKTAAMVAYINNLLELDEALRLPGSAKDRGRLLDIKGEQLLEIVSKQNQAPSAGEGHLRLVRPVTSFIESSLYTGAVHEPTIFSELQKEIQSSDHIELLVSFIKWSGLRLIIGALKSFTDKGGQLRVITTSYMGATDLKAIVELQQLKNTAIKISYDTKRTRLHAKAYVFYRKTGFTTSYIGSSNLSNAAISSGLEWNLKITAKDQPATLTKIKATFESYWNSSEFEAFDLDSAPRLSSALKAEKAGMSAEALTFNFDISPYTYQQDVLDKLLAEREIHGHFKNLIVAATGTGKTVIAAFDYKRHCQNNPGSSCRLLFIAHREEILQQAVGCFRGVLRDANFGDLYVGRHTAGKIDYLFMSIQTFNAKNWTVETSADFYDYIIVDEFHHAAAPSYQKLLTYYQPKILLGLTATPERMDELSILTYFDHRIAAEIRLPEAIDRKLLCPFQYFGVTDIVDLSSLKWIRGGYDSKELSKVYTMDQKIAENRARLILQKVLAIVTDIDEVKGLGFCVSVQHATFMSCFFNQYGVPSKVLSAESGASERSSARQSLLSGAVKFIFVVDLYNEGVDIPEINTVLFLRPTESLTVFLQQLGRGLRLAEKKECLTVLDFIGQASERYNFEQKFNALQNPARKSTQRAVKEAAFSVPAGCFITLEKLASAYILQNIKQSYGNKTALLTRIREFTQVSGHPLSLRHFLAYHQLSAKHIYPKYNFSRLCVEAGVRPSFDFVEERVFNKGMGRVKMINSRRWLSLLIEILDAPPTAFARTFSSLERRMLQMFAVTLWPVSELIKGISSAALERKLRELQTCTPLWNELKELLRWQYDQIDFVDLDNPFSREIPLDIHCSYSRDQILVAYDFMKPGTVREGVKFLPDFKTDLLFITLNKSDKDYSPSTMYNDYSISDTLMHCQSQSTTSERSVTGQRYIHHQRTGQQILLFAREYRTVDNQTAPYLFLGPVRYVQHEGSSPMNIIWQLEHSIPADFMRQTNKLNIG